MLQPHSNGLYIQLSSHRTTPPKSPVHLLRPEAVVTAFSWIGYLRIDVEGDVFLVFFILVFSIFGLYIIIALIILVCGEVCAALEETFAEILWYFLGDSILFGILFIPCASLALEMFNCEKGDDGDSYVNKLPSMECWTTEHIVCCSMSVIILLFIAIGIRTHADERDLYQHGQKSKKRVRVDVRNVDGRFAYIRFLGLIMGINIASVSPLAAAMIMFVLMLYPLGFNLWMVPYIDMRFNYGYVSMHAFNLWTSMAVIVTVLSPYQWIGFVIWCIFPVFIGSACYLCTRRLRARPLTAEDLEVDADFDSLNQQIQTENPYLNEVNYPKISKLLSERKKECLSFRPPDFGMLIYELQSNDAKVDQLKKQRELEKGAKKRKKKGAAAADEEQGMTAVQVEGGTLGPGHPAEEQRVSGNAGDVELGQKGFRFRSDWVCIYAQNQTELSQRSELKEDEVDLISRCIAGCGELVVLRLNGWNLKGESLRRFVDVALADLMNGDCRHPKLRVIDLGDNQMSVEDATYVLDKLNEMRSVDDLQDLQEICLTNNYIGDSKGADLQREHPLGKLFQF